MEAAAWSSRTIDAAAFAAVPFLGEEEDMMSIVVVVVTRVTKPCL